MDLTPSVIALHGACRDVDDPNIFHPEALGQGVAAATAEALTHCARCPVVAVCLDFADSIESGQTAHGIWGGLTPAQRIERRRAWRGVAS